jgi:hypothetical protein
MKPDVRYSIQDELQSAGANPGESTELERLATSLSRLKGTEPPGAPNFRLTGRQLSRQLFRRPWPHVLSAAAGVLLGVVLLAVAQSTVSGSWLYPLKRASEAITIQVAPSYRATAMMRRAEEVQQLVAHRGQPQLITNTLSDYRQTALAYKTKNYAAMEYCQRSLQQAETTATGPERQEIAATLSQLGPATD